jgi:hypothetical protein
MTELSALWLPIVLSAVLVFFASFLIHMFLGYHKADYLTMPNEDKVMDAIRVLNIPPGDYAVPKPRDSADMKSPEFEAKQAKGPVFFLTMIPAGRMQMGKYLLRWFIYNLVVAFLAAYIASRAVEPGAPYLEAFRFAGATTFIGYTLGLWQMSVWYHRSWGTSVRYTIDGLIFGLLTGGVFGWLWPR